MRRPVAWRTAGRPIIALAAAAALCVPGCVPAAKERPPTYEISKADYYDKTLAGILGQVGGVLTGYEFVSEEPLPDEWFALMKGPYSGNSEFVAQPQNDRLFEERGGAIGSDDDYHIDFLNQLILADSGPNVSSQEIREAWLKYEVSDWGGGGTAMDNMRQLGMLPPQTGQSEFNKFYWVTEPYIENDTIGMIAPGMPLTADRLTEKFASVSGEYDSVVWARFLGVMYSLAYFETDARVAMDKAADILPRDGWPYQMYLKVKALYKENPDDWRWAQGELRKVKRMVYGWDNIQVIPDINNALAMLAIQYGNNDYMESAKIASLSGYDADCTASFVMGLMGIVHGMDGTPQVVKDTIYKDGEGVYVNDMEFTPHMGRNYPAEQKFADIVKLYVSNAENMIVAHGGSVEGDKYRIAGEPLSPAIVVPVTGGDFEAGTLEGWTADASADRVYAQNNGNALSGDWNGRIDVDGTMRDGKLYTTAKGLTKGATYRVQAYLTADAGVEARLYVDSGGGESAYASVTDRVGSYAGRTLEFKASGKSAVIGLEAVAGEGAAGSAAIDDVTVQRIAEMTGDRHEAESAAATGFERGAAKSASGGGYAALPDEAADGPAGLSFTGIHADEAGEYRLRIGYANGWSGTVRLGLAVNGTALGSAWLPQTGAADAFSANAVDIPVLLNKGDNVITLSRGSRIDGMASIDYIELSSYPKAVRE
ncbi:ADP-ribosylglycohydrolase family protein [Cohnella sp. 56]|uniref:ADP-ribosylglycohydrolase family protein n=1 Tax=Cohnella sp. 56 TaxID=3113722 RepID=UPI0030EA3789